MNGLRAMTAAGQDDAASFNDIRFSGRPPIKSARTRSLAHRLALQTSIFALVAAAFANIYITQPVLPVLEAEFDSDMVQVSLTVSLVILGITLSTLPFGMLADRWKIQPLILSGGAMVALGGLICATTPHLGVLIVARFLQGLFIPALTTCLAAYLARALAFDQLNVAMGLYVSATVFGGLSGRLLGGWSHYLLHWRYAFGVAAVMTLLTALIVLQLLPRTQRRVTVQHPASGLRALLSRRDIWRIYLCAAGSFAAFSSIFNYLPFHLAAPPLQYTTDQITWLYLVYIIGVFIGPVAGRLSNRVGSGNTFIGAAVVFGGSMGIVLLPSIVGIVVGLVGICSSFFAIHAAAVGALNKKLSGGQGRANALYVLFYYAGGWLGITAAGGAYQLDGWRAVIYMGWCLLLLPVWTGLGERSVRPK